MTEETKAFAMDIFSIPAKPKRKPPEPWVAVWPCGTEFELQKTGNREWEAPEIKDGEQTGVTFIEPTRADLASLLRGYGCEIQKGYSKK